MKKMILLTGVLLALTLSGCTGDGSSETQQATLVDKADASIEESEADQESDQSNKDVEEERKDAIEEEVQEEEVQEGDTIMAPDFTLMNKEGLPITLSDYRGKIVFLNFFATWCGYCEDEMADFQSASEKYSDDVVFLIVDAFTTEKVSKEEVIDWYESRGLTMEMVIDEEGILTQDYPVQGFPTTFFIGREGDVLAYYPGLMETELIDKVVAEFK